MYVCICTYNTHTHRQHRHVYMYIYNIYVYLRINIYICTYMRAWPYVNPQPTPSTRAAQKIKQPLAAFGMLVLSPLCFNTHTYADGC